MSNIDNNNINNNEIEEKVMLSGRVNLSVKEQIDALWKDEDGNIIPGKSYNSALEMLLEALKSRPVKNEGLNFTEDILAIEKAMSSITNVINGIKGKTNAIMTETIDNVNQTLDKKDTALNNYKATAEEMFDSLKEQIVQLRKEKDELSEQLADALLISDAKDTEIHALERNLAEKNNEINSIKSEKDKLIEEGKEYVAKATDLQNQINNLKQLEEKNKELSSVIDSTKAERDRAITKLELKSAELDRISKELTYVKSSLDITTKEKSELILKYKEELIDAKDSIKKDLEKEHDKEIKKFKEKIMDLEIKLDKEKSKEDK